MSDTLLQTIGLKKYFMTPRGPLHAVDNINISIERGETLGVVGESGCGKSTLGRVILRLIPRGEGQVFFEGENIFELNNAELKQKRRVMQIIFQDPYSSLNPRMTVFNLVANPLRVNHVCKSKSELNKRVLALMDMVGLSQRFAFSYPHELDGGRRQRIGIARALALNPKFIVCDEPVSALDVSIQAQILNLLMDLQDEMNLTYMFITHDLSVVRHISNNIMVMYLGQCVEYAPAKELFKQPAHPYTKALLAAIPIPSFEYIGKKADLLRGEIKSPINPPPGCRFKARCNIACDKCNSDLEITEISPGHFVSCLLYSEGKRND
jgi:oligopeptide/dipeptide ABC transporter ATP-binding protein